MGSGFAWAMHDGLPIGSHAERSHEYHTYIDWTCSIVLLAWKCILNVVYVRWTDLHNKVTCSELRGEPGFRDSAELEGSVAANTSDI